MNINRIRNNRLDGNDVSDSHFQLHLNNTTPRSTSQSNTRFNDNNDVFRLNTTNTFRRTSESNQSTLPTAFNDMSNIHQICSWLCENPNILLLAYNIYLSMQTPIGNAFNFTSLNFNSLTLATGVPQIPKQEDKVNVAIIYCFISFYY